MEGPNLAATLPNYSGTKINVVIYSTNEHLENVAETAFQYARLDFFGASFNKYRSSDFVKTQGLIQQTKNVKTTILIDLDRLNSNKFSDACNKLFEQSAELLEMYVVGLSSANREKNDEELKLKKRDSDAKLMKKAKGNHIITSQWKPGTCIQSLPVL